jgi:hypothetical protein
MAKDNQLRYGAPGDSAVHICVDMQRMFAEGTDWKMSWLPRVLPNIVAIPKEPSLRASSRPGNLAKEPACGGAIMNAGDR